MAEEYLAKTRHPKIFIGKIGTYPDEKVRHALQRLAVLARDGQENDLRRFLNEFLPEARLSVEPGGALSKAVGQSAALSRPQETLKESTS